MSLMNKIKKYYRYVIDTDDVNVQTVSDYARRYGSLKNMKLKIFQTKRKDNINSFEVIGDFPSGTKLWITNGIGPLTEEEYDSEQHGYIQIPNVVIIPTKRQYVKLTLPKKN